MRQKVLPLLQQHDMLCDLLSQLALEVRQSMAVDRDIDSKVRDCGTSWSGGLVRLLNGRMSYTQQMCDMQQRL